MGAAGRSADAKSARVLTEVGMVLSLCRIEHGFGFHQLPSTRLVYAEAPPEVVLQSKYHVQSVHFI